MEPKRLKCIHCGHRVEAITCVAADRLMVTHYLEAHPERTYCDPAALDYEDAVADACGPLRNEYSVRLQ